MTERLYAQTPQTRGVALTRKLWTPGQTITVEFMDGAPELHALVIKYVLEMRLNLNYVWSAAGQPNSGGTASLPPTRDHAMVRISFEREGSWSYLGQDALLIPPKDPTMNFGWLDWALEEENFVEAERVIQHEWMHFLGMRHEQEHPDCRLQISQAGYDYFASIGWTRANVQRTYETRAPRDEATFGPYDVKSLTHYWLQPEHDVTGVGVEYANVLSDGDWRYFARNYGPLRDAPDPPPIVVVAKPKPKVITENKIYMPFIAN